MKFLENKTGCTEEVTGIWRKSHCYFSAQCQPGTLSLHSTSDAPWEMGKSHSRLSWRSKEQRPEVSKEPLEHSASQGQPEPSDRCDSVYFLQRCLLLALSGTKASLSTCDESSLTPCSCDSKGQAVRSSKKLTQAFPALPLVTTAHQGALRQVQGAAARPELCAYG